MPYLYCHCPEFKDCSFRIYNLEFNIDICNFPKTTSNIQSSRLHYLTNKACDWIKTEKGRQRSIRILHKKRNKEFLKYAQSGDIVFCSVENPPEVKLLERPINDSKFVSCQRLNGTIVRIQACHLYRISKGNYYGDYFIKGIENEKIAMELEFQSKYYGFRAKLVKKSDGFFLKIYGDSQQEVDDFINLFIHQKFELIF